MGRNKKKFLGCMISLVILALGAAGYERFFRVAKETQVPEITIMFPGAVTDQRVLKRVSEALSEVTEEKIGCRVVLSMLSSSDYRSKMKYKVLGEEEADAFFVWELEDLQYVIAGGYARNLETYMDDYPELKNEVSRASWRAYFSEGTYAIPENKDQSYYLGFVCKKRFLDGVEIDRDKIYTMAELHEILLAVKYNYPDIVPVAAHLGMIAESIGEDMAGDGLAVLLRDENGAYCDQFENFYASDSFYNWCSTMYHWNQEGLIDPYLTQNMEPQSTYLALDGFGYFSRVKDYVVTNNEYFLQEELVVIRLSEELVDNTLDAVNWCVSLNSKEPEKTLAFINLLFTDPQVYEICRYGERDIDYMIDEEGKYQLIRGVGAGYSTTGWVWPDQNLTQKNLEDAIISPAYGFVFDTDKVQVEMDLCKVVVQKYRNALMAGEVNPRLAIPQMIRELGEAGVDTIIAEKQEQFDMY